MQKLSDIQAAEQEAAQLVEKARNDAAQILANAKSDAAQIVAEGTAETRKLARTHGTKYVLQAQQEAQSLIEAAAKQAQLELPDELLKKSVTVAVEYIVR